MGPLTQSAHRTLNLPIPSLIFERIVNKGNFSLLYQRCLKPSRLPRTQYNQTLSNKQTNEKPLFLSLCLSLNIKVDMV